MAIKEPFPGVPWIHLSDANDGVLDMLAEQHEFHELDVEDCRHSGQIAKVVEHAKYNFVVIKTIEYNKEARELTFHDFNLFIMPDLLVTVAEGATGVVTRTHDRLPAEPEFHYARGVAYLMMDTAVDEYLPVLDEVGGMIEDIEEEVLASPTPQVLQKIFQLKRLLIEFRRNCTAMREVLSHMMRITRAEVAGSVLPYERRRATDAVPAAVVDSGNSLYPYYRDIYDHVVRALDFIETYRDLATGSMDIYLSAVANRTNEVMKRLTVYGTISIPVLAITGFYGMNVALPLQSWPHAANWVMAFLAAIIALLLLLFWKKGWM